MSTRSRLLFAVALGILVVAAIVDHRRGKAVEPMPAAPPPDVEMVSGQGLISLDDTLEGRWWVCGFGGCRRGKTEEQRR